MKSLRPKEFSLVTARTTLFSKRLNLLDSSITTFASGVFDLSKAFICLDAAEIKISTSEPCSICFFKVPDESKV